MDYAGLELVKTNMSNEKKRWSEVQVTEKRRNESVTIGNIQFVVARIINLIRLPNRDKR